MAKHCKCQFVDARKCPNCGKKQTMVRHSLSNNHGLQRRRLCLKCGHRYNTIEVHMDFLEEVFGDAGDQEW